MQSSGSVQMATITLYSMLRFILDFRMNVVWGP